MGTVLAPAEEARFLEAAGDKQQSPQKRHFRNWGIAPGFPGRTVLERMALGKFRDVQRVLWLKVGEAAAVTSFLVSEPWPPPR